MDLTTLDMEKEFSFDKNMASMDRNVWLQLPVSLSNVQRLSRTSRIYADDLVQPFSLAC